MKLLLLSSVTWRTPARRTMAAVPQMLHVDLRPRSLRRRFRFSWALVTDSRNKMELLGELQVAFVLFISLSSLRGFRHWQELSALLCRCGDALATHPALFTAFIRVSPAEITSRSTMPHFLCFFLLFFSFSFFFFRLLFVGPSSRTIGKNSPTPFDGVLTCVRQLSRRNCFHISKSWHPSRRSPLRTGAFHVCLRLSVCCFCRGVFVWLIAFYTLRCLSRHFLSIYVNIQYMLFCRRCFMHIFDLYRKTSSMWSCPRTTFWRHVCLHCSRCAIGIQPLTLYFPLRDMWGWIRCSVHSLHVPFSAVQRAAECSSHISSCPLQFSV